MILLGVALAALAAETPPESPVEAAIDEALAQPIENIEAFICADGHRIAITHDATAGVLHGVRDGEEFTLMQEVSRRGIARFVNGSDSIMLAGDTAWLQRSREVRQTCDRIPDQPTPGIVWGKVNAGADLVVPNRSNLKVLLVDGARADAPAVEIASTMLRTTGKQAPFWFLIRYDPNRALAPAQPALRANLRLGRNGQRLFTDKAVSIPTDGTPAPSPVELVLDHSTSE